MKKVIGKKHRKEGREERLFSVIQCQDCGALTYERRASRIETALNSKCKSCCNQSHKSYHSYGGSGIEVCLRWLVDFWAFVEDMGERPEGTTLDRIDNEDNYSPLNCRWATHQEQMLNRSNGRVYSLLTDDEHKEQQRIKLKLYYQRNYVSTGRPRGRPRKSQKK